MLQLTTTQQEIIDNLISEFKQMNAPRVSSKNPFLDIREEFNSDKKLYEENVAKVEAKSKVLHAKIIEDFEMLANHFNELGYEGLDLECLIDKSSSYTTIRFRLGGSTFFSIDARIDYESKRFGEFHLKSKLKIVYEIAYHTTTLKYSSIEELMESRVFRQDAMRLIKRLEELKNK